MKYFMALFQEAKCKVTCRNGWSLKNKRDKPTNGIGMRIKCKGNEWSYMKKGNKERLGLKGRVKNNIQKK